jgi:phage portal protein BeeE
VVKYINPITHNIQKFKQVIPWKTDIWFDRDEIAYFQLEEDPNNTYNWLPLLEWIIWESLSDLEASKSNFYFFKNNWVPNAIFMLDDEDYSEEEIEMASSKIKGDLTWSENAHKFIISNWIKDVKTLWLSNKDLEFINLRKLTTEKVCAVFWVPKSILWYIDVVNYSNAEQLSETFIENTVNPNAVFLEYVINAIYNKFISTDLFSQWYKIKLDSETLSKRESIETGQREDMKLWILTINEIRKERGLEEYKDEEANKPLIPKGFSLLEDLTVDANIDFNE